MKKDMISFDPLQDEKNRAVHGLPLATAALLFENEFVESEFANRVVGQVGETGTTTSTMEQAHNALAEWATPENLAWFDALTDEDIAAQITSNPDAAPELDDAWFERARLVIPLKGRRAA
jgi:hypothetical protein